MVESNHQPPSKKDGFGIGHAIWHVGKHVDIMACTDCTFVYVAFTKAALVFQEGDLF